MSVTSKKNKALLTVILCIAIFLMTCMPVFAESGGGTRELIVGGELFGLQMKTDGIPVVGLDKVDTVNSSRAPAYEAGIKLGDVIIKVNGEKAISAKHITDKILYSNGAPVCVTAVRNGKRHDISIIPALSKEGKYRAGIWIRDSAAGIGTVTYIDPKTNEFAGLGHGICDGDTTSLLPLSRGIVTDVELSGIVKGKSGTPGELKGSFKGSKKGALVKNTKQGVYGVVTALPQNYEKMQTANIGEVTEGEAFIRSSVSGEKKDYKITIERITPKSTNYKNFTIRIIDPSLIALTGGIVQGMGV